MTGRGVPLLALLDRVDLTAEEREYIAGAVHERSVVADRQGLSYGWAEFIHDALLDAASR